MWAKAYWDFNSVSETLDTLIWKVNKIHKDRGIAFSAEQMGLELLYISLLYSRKVVGA